VRKQLEGDLTAAVGIQLASATGAPADNGFFGAIGAFFGLGHGEFTLDTRITPGAGTRLTCESVICFQNRPDSEGPQYLFLTDGANELVSLLPNGSSVTVVDAGPTLRSIALDTVSAALSVAVSYIINKIGFSGKACMQQVKQMTLSIAYELVWRVISTVQLLVNGEVNRAVRKLLDSIVALPAIMIRSSSVMIGVCAVDMLKPAKLLNEQLLKGALSMVLDPFFVLDIGASVTSYFLSASSAITNLNKTSRIVITTDASSAVASSAQSEDPAVSESESPASTVTAGVASDCSLRGPGVDLHGCELTTGISQECADGYAPCGDLSGLDLRNADLSGAMLMQADLRGTKLDGANLSGANLSGAYLWGATFKGANFNGAIIDVWVTGDVVNFGWDEIYWDGSPDTDLMPVPLDLRDVDFRGARIAASLRGADLRGANFSGADLSGSYFSGAILSGANFRGAKLDYVDFYDTDLRGVDFTGASALNAEFVRTIMPDGRMPCPSAGSPCVGRQVYPWFP
jgi:uncharacterized protein YjbI with pentapeptide repeats